MTILLDARTSQNASFSNSISIPILVGTEDVFGQIGLNVANATSPITVQFTGTIATQLPLLPLATTITITVVRGTDPTDPVVYSTSQSLDLSILGPQLFTFTGSDYNVPIPATNQLVYTAFISSNILGTVRVGPESFNGTAYSE